MPNPIDKRALLDQVIRELRVSLDTAVAAQRKTLEGATHEESKPENDKDTRALEASYLARGQARRVVELEEALTGLQSVSTEPVQPGEIITIGALVEVRRSEEDDTEFFYVLPAAGADRVTWADQNARIVSPESLLGRSLLGRFEGDGVEVRLPQGLREYAIERVH